MSQDEAAVNEPVEQQDATPTESAPVETKETPEVASDDALLKTLQEDDDSPAVETDSKEEAPKEEAKETEPESESEDTPTEETQDEPQGEEKPLSPKAENRFQKLANENKQLKEYIEGLHQQVYKPQTVEELVDEGLSQEMAEVRSLKQQLEVNDYTNRVYEAQVGLSNDSSKVLEDFPIFNPDSPDYQEDLAVQAAVQLESVLIRDPNVPEIDPVTNRPSGKGQIIGSHLSPYQIYKPIADAYKKSHVLGQVKGQKAQEQMLASADAQASSSPKEPKKDPLLEIWASDD